MTSKEELLINQLATAQSGIVSLNRQNKELSAIVEECQILLSESTTNFDTMAEQRDQFLQLAKNLDNDFNNGKIFSK
tara:strand:- start:1737 stop:1967 length:231 start_codon:yes stop_codon:yes gene_type:complete